MALVNPFYLCAKISQSTRCRFIGSMSSSNSAARSSATQKDSFRVRLFIWWQIRKHARELIPRPQLASLMYASFKQQNITGHACAKWSVRSARGSKMEKTDVERADSFFPTSHEKEISVPPVPGQKDGKKQLCPWSIGFIVKAVTVVPHNEGKRQQISKWAFKT